MNPESHGLAKQLLPIPEQESSPLGIVKIPKNE
jgi:hypothetical protein